MIIAATVDCKSFNTLDLSQLKDQYTQLVLFVLVFEISASESSASTPVQINGD